MGRTGPGNSPLPVLQKHGMAFLSILLETGTKNMLLTGVAGEAMKKQSAHETAEVIVTVTILPFQIQAINRVGLKV